MRNKYILIGLSIIVALAAAVVMVLAGNPSTPPGPPETTSSYTLNDIYDRLNTGAAATPSTFTEPSSGPAVGTMHTLDEIYDLIGERAPVPQTGQTISYTVGDDGDLERGVVWPDPRFTDNGDGTVTDNLTGLVWLKNINCTAFFAGDTTGNNWRSWSDAFAAARSLSSGYCGLADGSSAGDWRLPNIRELQSLIDYSKYGTPPDSALPEGHPFTVQNQNYWSSTTWAAIPSTYVWSLNLGSGDVNTVDTNTVDDLLVWPVRGGQ
jgi:hypothetical protein